MMMLRPIPEDESDHGVDPDVDSLAAAAVASTLDGGGGGGGGGGDSSSCDLEAESSRSVRSGSSAVLADPESGGGGGRNHCTREGLLQPKQKRGGKKRSNRKDKQGQRSRSSKKRRELRWSTWKSFAVMSVVIVAAVVIVVLILATNTESVPSVAPAPSGGGGGGVTSSPTQAPLGAATPPPTQDPQIAIELDALLDPLSVSSNESDSNSVTTTVLQAARSSAREWILTSDLLRDEVMADPTLIRLKQRYVLALTFYSMQFDPDINRNGTFAYDVLMSEESECKWHGIYCDETVVDMTETTTITVSVVRRIEWAGWKATGVLPPEVRWLKYLQELNVSNNALVGTIPNQWFGIPSNMTEAENWTDFQVERDHYLPYLYMVDASYNQLNGALPKKIWLLPSLRFIYFTNNSLTGSLPSESFFESMEAAVSPYLEDVWLDHNQLQGVLPNWLLTSRIFRSLILVDNQFNGTQFDELVEVPDSLVILDLSYNHFTGVIPAALFQGASLAYLYLDHNHFSSLEYDNTMKYNDTSVPLVDVWLYANQLQGEIPPDFGISWFLLEELLIHGNPQWSGTIINGCNNSNTMTTLWPNLERMEADCLPLSSSTELAPVVCECCTSCA